MSCYFVAIYFTVRSWPFFCLTLLILVWYLWHTCLPFCPQIWEILAPPPRTPLSRLGTPQKVREHQFYVRNLHKLRPFCGPISERLPRKSGELASMTCGSSLVLDLVHGLASLSDITLGYVHT